MNPHGYDAVFNVTAVQYDPGDGPTDLLLMPTEDFEEAVQMAINFLEANDVDVDTDDLLVVGAYTTVHYPQPERQERINRRYSEPRSKCCNAFMSYDGEGVLYCKQCFKGLNPITAQPLTGE